ncbi:hypothetical protein K431DRAFT_105402 [Polychaeton citri CBS 116435]|uniref:Uncharacterized protein n=1 Tax=Polychaeton citri CBS 116435 TaxID=1314669 RepID=A0A9P4Q4W1_9PEZI|nr:hypothetical protein K431DRAFT_105402 [Polychaeton citri CBS 116435]
MPTVGAVMLVAVVEAVDVKSPSLSSPYCSIASASAPIAIRAGGGDMPLLPSSADSHQPHSPSRTRGDGRSCNARLPCLHLHWAILGAMPDPIVVADGREPSILTNGSSTHIFITDAALVLCPVCVCSPSLSQALDCVTAVASSSIEDSI